MPNKDASPALTLSGTTRTSDTETEPVMQTSAMAKYPISHHQPAVFGAATTFPGVVAFEGNNTAAEGGGVSQEGETV